MSDRDGCVVISEGIEVSGAIGRRTNVYLGRLSGATGGGGVASLAFSGFCDANRWRSH